MDRLTCMHVCMYGCMYVWMDVEHQRDGQADLLCVGQLLEGVGVDCERVTHEGEFGEGDAPIQPAFEARGKVHGGTIDHKQWQAVPKDEEDEDHHEGAHVALQHVADHQGEDAIALQGP